MLTVILTVIHVLVCLFMVVVVLLQSGKAADLAGAFGGMGSQTTFGPRGTATALSKATTVAAVVFMITSMSLAILATRSRGVSSSILDSTHAKPLSVPAQQPPQIHLGGQQVNTAPVKPSGQPAQSQQPAQKK